MRVTVFGLGYVGSVTAACLASAGHEVTGVDINKDKVAMVNNGMSPIVEQGLKELLVEMVEAGMLKATTSTEEAVRNSDIALICVGTPSRSNGQLDPDAIARVGKEIGHALRQRTEPYTIILRSTVLPGTTERLLIPALEEGAGRKLGASLKIAVNPEFMREGSALIDFEKPPMTLVGCDDSETASLLRSLYAGVEAPFVETSIKTAEMVKYVSNCFHALKVCFANEIGDMSTAFGIDAQEVMRIFRMDHKLNISETYLRPGFAFGGSCLPKDLRAILSAARASDISLPLLSSIPISNDGQIRKGVETVLKTKKKRVGVIGLSFKPGTDDLRESPMVTLVETLIGKGFEVRILDRNVSLARLIGANRQYIEEEIPHIASLMCQEVETLMAKTEVLVIGNACEEATLALTLLRPDQIVVDLTRGVAQPALAGEVES
jgi:GDP-mannose 6-dehydrogenase